MKGRGDCPPFLSRNDERIPDARKNPFETDLKKNNNVLLSLSDNLLGFVQIYKNVVKLYKQNLITSTKLCVVY